MKVCLIIDLALYLLFIMIRVKHKLFKGSYWLAMDNSSYKEQYKIVRGLYFTKGDWSSGMIPVLGTGGPGFNSRIAPFLYISMQHTIQSTHKSPG